MKRLFIVLVLAVISLSNFSIYAGNYNKKISQCANKKGRKHISLGVRVGLSFSSLPQISLFQNGDFLEASIEAFEREIAVQITDGNGSNVSETIIKQFEKDWFHSISFLQPGQTYTIRFIVPSAGHLYGKFSF